MCNSFTDRIAGPQTQSELNGTEIGLLNYRG